jgi:hypothetical protein
LGKGEEEEKGGRKWGLKLQLDSFRLTVDGYQLEIRIPLLLKAV